MTNHDKPAGITIGSTQVSAKTSDGKTIQASVPVAGSNMAPDTGVARALVEAFAAQLEALKSGLKPGELVLLAFGEGAEKRVLKKIDLKVQAAEVISVSALWDDGENEQRVFTAQNFSPILSKDSESNEDLELLTDETRSLVQQVLGHLTAHGVLYTQMLARDAEMAGDARTFLDNEHARALEVVRTANISVAGMDVEDIRNKALAVVDQAFDSIQINGSADKRVLN